MEITEQQKRELQTAIEQTTEVLKGAKIFINITITEDGAHVATVGDKKELLAALMYSDAMSSCILLEQLTQVRETLGEAIRRFLDIKDKPDYKAMILFSKIMMASRIKDKENK